MGDAGCWPYPLEDRHKNKKNKKMGVNPAENNLKEAMQERYRKCRRVRSDPASQPILPCQVCGK